MGNGYNEMVEAFGSSMVGTLSSLPCSICSPTRLGGRIMTITGVITMDEADRIMAREHRQAALIMALTALTTGLQDLILPGAVTVQRSKTGSIAGQQGRAVPPLLQGLPGLPQGTEEPVHAPEVVDLENRLQPN